jgi:hypothetical protein
MIEMMKSARNDSGDPFVSIIGTKYYNFGLFDVEKIFRNPALWFKYIQSGVIRCEIWFDGNSYAGTATIGSVDGGAGVGIDLMGGSLPGSSVTSVEQVTARADIVHELTIMSMARSMGLYLIDNNYNSNWVFMGVHIPYTILDGKPADDLTRSNVA